MKNKYQRLSKENKKIVEKAYRESNAMNANISLRLRRSSITFGLGILYSIGMVIYLLITEGKWWEYVAFGFIIIICLVLMLRAIDYYHNLLNKFAIDHKKDFMKKIPDFEKM